MLRNEAHGAVEPITIDRQPATDTARIPDKKRSPASSAIGVARRWLHEPLLHFLVIAGALFAIYEILHPSSRGEAASKRIELTVDDLRQLEIAFTAQWHRPPTPKEATGLVEGRVREEILFREALALGLDKEDTIVRRRMAQKMEFLAEDLASIRVPTKEELQTWFEKNSQRFAQPPRAAFRHLYFSPDRRGQNARGDAARALEKLSAADEGSPEAAALADRFMYQNYYGDRSPEQLSKEFGPKFAWALFQLAPGSWRGPIESGFGWHLVWIESIIPERLPAFEEVEDDVKEAWTADWRDEVKRKAYLTMRSQYDIVLPESSPDAFAATPPMQLRVNEP
jgi:peptidyl-prolyl cis-trans isomerase C